MQGAIWAPKPNHPEAINKFEQIIYNYEKYANVKMLNYKKSSNKRVVHFENGDTWYLINYVDSGLGYRFNISYIHRSIPTDVVNSIIRPCTTVFPYNGIFYYGEPT
jgi:hypothetical protein